MAAATNKAPGPAGRGVDDVPIGKHYRKATLKQVPLSSVLLDCDNPRIRFQIAQRKGKQPPTQEELQALLMRQPASDELMGRIRDNGGVVEPIYLRPDMRVIEGNGRIAVCRHLLLSNHPHLAHIRAWVFHDIDDRDVAVLQGMLHVAGKTTWRAYEQAGHIHHMRNALDMKTSEIAAEVGLKDNDVKRLLAAYDGMQKYVLPTLKHDGLKKFSYFAELYKIDELQAFREKPANVKLFGQLVVEGKLKKGAQVRLLPTIIEHDELETLRTKGIEAASTAIGKFDPTVGDLFLKRVQTMAAKLHKAPLKLIHKLRNEAGARRILRDLIAAATELDRESAAPPKRGRK